MRYGENPHQSAIVGANIFSSGGVARSEQVHGLGMSYTNYLDADAAFTSISEFSDQGVAIIKHANPCGLALESNQSEAYRKAHEGDPVSAYGGIVAFNTKVTEERVLAMKGHYYDVILAPDDSKEALEILKNEIGRDFEWYDRDPFDTRLVFNRRFSPLLTDIGKYQAKATVLKPNFAALVIASSPPPCLSNLTIGGSSISMTCVQ